ncbi:MAG: nucleotidyl transferase AbiEii/AbiGii toxin family protein [Anaeromyxobacteraceae bacterium]
MRKAFAPRLDALPPEQKGLWQELRPAASLGFVLYGGTAIALRLGHRPSVDFDFFTEGPLDRHAVRAALPFMTRATVVQDAKDALSVLVPGSGGEHSHVKVSFFGGIDFGRVGVPERTEDGVLLVASLDDLMATKVKVVLQRAEAKDYRDVASMIRAGVSLARGLAAARAMFGPEFQPSESLKALVFFGDGDLPTLTGDERATLIAAVREVRELPKAEIVSSRLG